jgi:hypothetical protein
MIDTLLGRIAGFFDKDFLFSSFLPALIFFISLFVPAATTVGMEAVWVWIDSRTTTQTAAITLATTILVVVLAYVLHALRGTFTYVWSGNSRLFLFVGMRTAGEHIQRRRFLRLRKNANRFSRWPQLQEEFRVNVSALWDPAKVAPDPLELHKLVGAASRIRQLRDLEMVRLGLKQLVEAYRKYSGNSLCEVYENAKRALMDHDEEERGQIQTESHELDRKFGSLNTVKATALGNIIESYQQYPSKRYKLESEIFWPRLREVVPPDYLTTVHEPRILLDFGLTMASLEVIYCSIVLLVGPWIWFNPVLWTTVGFVSLLLAYLFYSLAVNAAYQYGELVRSTFDLFRLDLMEALGLPHPANLFAERTQWEEFSRLAAYGTSANITFAKRKKK